MKLAARLALVLCIVCLGLTAISQPNNTDGASGITRALRERRFADALNLLGPALRQSPDNAQLWTLQGLAYTGEERKDKALYSFQHALKLSPDYLPALEGAAQIEFATGGAEARPLLERVLKAVPGDTTAHAMLASLAYKDHNCPEAISHFEQAGPGLESEPIAERQYATCLARAEHLDKAIAVLETLLAQPGSVERDRLQLAVLELQAGRPSDAYSTLQPSLAEHPTADVLSLAAEACEEQEDTPQAVKLLHQAITENPKDIDLYLQFADLSFVHQSFQVGVDMTSAGINAQPNAAALYLARGILLVQLSDYDHADADFEKAEKLEPQQGISDAARGLMAEQKDDPDKALAVVRARLAANPNDPLLLYVKADILVQKGPEPGTPEFSEAVSAAKRASELQPSLVAARDTLAKLYLQADENQLAVDVSREALRQDPDDQVALYHLIVGLRKTGHKDELPGLLQRLAEARQKATLEEGEHNRYKLIEQSDTAAPQGK
jgi:tetratricopeptide (TPR) repeat protein